MLRQALADLDRLVQGRDHVEDARRQPGLGSEIGERESTVRRLASSLGDDGAASGEGGGQSSGEHSKGKVPRRDDGARTDGLLEDEASARRVRQRNDLAVSAHALGRVPVKVSVAAGDLEATLVEDLAVLSRDDPSEIFGMLLDERVQLEDDGSSLMSSRRLPGLERLDGVLDGDIDVLSALLRQISERLASRWIDDLERSRSRSVGPLAVAERSTAPEFFVLQLEHRWRFRSHLSSRTSECVGRGAIERAAAD